jgi:hypothetical protein
MRQGTKPIIHKEESRIIRKLEESVFITPTEYEGESKSFWTGCLELELQIVQLSATNCSCITIL